MTDAYTWYGGPDPADPFEQLFEQLPAEAARCFQMAAAAHERFGALPAYDSHMQLIPLDGNGGKRPGAGFLPSRHTVPKRVEALALMAAACRENVGIRSRRAVGALLVIDCDEPGVLDRVQRETGRRPPLTYTTQTRPLSAPHKMHLYYMSTEHSVQKIRRQVTDVTGVCGYDLKGCGGWGHVAAEGCVREDGETVVAMYDVPIAPIPDWLVDFLVADIAKARAMMKVEKAAAKAKPAPKPAPKPQRVRDDRIPAAVSRGDRTWVVASRVRTWKNTGMSDDEIMPLLAAHIRAHFEDGDELLTPDGIRKLRAMVRRVPTLGAEASLRNLTRHRRSRRSTIPLATLRERFLSCPQDITPADARAFFSVRNRADHQRLLREFRRHGYRYVGSQGSHAGIWSSRPAAHNFIPARKLSRNRLTETSLFFSQGSSSFKRERSVEAPQHKEVCMSSKGALDPQVADEFFIHTHTARGKTVATEEKGGTALCRVKGENVEANHRV